MWTYRPYASEQVCVCLHACKWARVEGHKHCVLQPYASDVSVREIDVSCMSWELDTIWIGGLESHKRAKEHQQNIISLKQLNCLILPFFPLIWFFSRLHLEISKVKMNKMRNLWEKAKKKNFKLFQDHFQDWWCFSDGERRKEDRTGMLRQRKWTYGSGACGMTLSRAENNWQSFLQSWVVHIDDYTIIASTSHLIEDFKASVCKNVEVTDLGKPHWMLSLMIKCDWEGGIIHILQHAYIDSILWYFHLDNLKPCVICRTARPSVPSTGQHLPPALTLLLPLPLLPLLPISPQTPVQHTGKQ